MFESKPDPQITELITILKALLKKIEAQDKAWKILADHVGKLDNPNVAAFGTVRR
jgi:hypothetical protein